MVPEVLDLTIISSFLKIGWRDSILSLSKKWLTSTPPATTNVGSVNDSETMLLPKLPVPELEQTLNKYEKTMRPLLNDEQHKKLRKIIEEFKSPTGLGPKLQKYLLDRQEKLDNWAYDYWLTDMYLGNPAALPVNSNPGMVFPPRKFTTILDVARFGARILNAALEYKTMLDNKQLPLERATSRQPGQPLCMAQYYRMFSSCRIPGLKKDKQFLSSTSDSNKQQSEHVIVVCRNHFYCLVIKASDRGSLTEDEICSQLLYILNNAPCLSAPTPVGILTGWRRYKWAEARQKLLKNDRNVRNIELIEKSLLVLCMDEALSNNFNSHIQRGATGHVAGGRDETNLALQMLHGGGSTQNSGNRWFDKTVQLIISGDGAFGLCYEHSPAEAVAIISAMEKILKEAESFPHNPEVPATCDHLPTPERLEWILQIEDVHRIEEAAQHLDNLIKDLDFLVLRFDGYGKDFMKACKVSPDVYVQLALQLAYYKIYAKLTATYESASTRRYRLGRVDCIRSASTEALEWVSTMTQVQNDDDSNNRKVTFHLVTQEEKLRLWQQAVKKQTQEMIDNILGQGIDIHLLGLREAAKETSPTASHPLPELFTNESYRIANRFNLSTSQVATSIDSFMGYGPVEPDGYGASYNIKPNSIVFCLSSFWSSQVTSTSKFAQALEESLLSMRSLLAVSASVQNDH